MLNWIWFFLLAGGVLYAAATGNIAVVTEAAFAAAGDTVLLIIEICGMMCLWLGMLRIAQASGMVKGLGRSISPLVRRMFPSVPTGHPALEPVVMNIAANLLGLGNAATPFGLKAMEQLQTLNNEPKIASAPMITLLALNTSSVTLLPTLVISLRASAGSADATCIVGATIISSLTGLLFALLLDRALQRKHFRRRR